MSNRQIQFRIHESSPLESHSLESRNLGIDLNQLLDLFQAGAFWAQNRHIEDLALAIAHSHPVVTVWDGERLIGFARATSDWVYRAMIWDVVIHPDYRGTGLGRKLVETVLSHPAINQVERVYLTTTHHQQFYERIGFQANGSTTMVLNNHRSDPLNTTALGQSQNQLLT
jgi:N-acetylglutamate synthase-like GNAT family acetyltransferase